MDGDNDITLIMAQLMERISSQSDATMDAVVMYTRNSTTTNNWPMIDASLE